MSARNRMSFDLVERLDKSPAPAITPALLKRIFSFLTPYTPYLVASFGVIVLSSGLSVAPSLLTGQIIDRGLLAGDLPLLIRLVALSFLLLVVSSGLGLLESWPELAVRRLLLLRMTLLGYDDPLFLLVGSTDDREKWITERYPQMEVYDLTE